MSNLNKFNNSQQVFEKNPKLCLIKKKSLRTHKECLNNFFDSSFFTTNTLCANVYKMYECDKNQMPHCNVKNFKMSKILGF